MKRKMLSDEEDIATAGFLVAVAEVFSNGQTGEAALARFPEVRLI